jgi:hypothetical protein
MRAESFLGQLVVALSRRTPAYVESPAHPPAGRAGRFWAALSRRTPAYASAPSRTGSGKTKATEASALYDLRHDLRDDVRDHIARILMFDSGISTFATLGGRADRADRSANLSRSILNGADLSGSELHGADLSDVQLRGANLHQINLSKARLDRAQLNGAFLTDADLRGASLVDADLEGVGLTGTKWDESTVWPENYAERIRTASVETAPGEYQVGPGTERSPLRV